MQEKIKSLLKKGILLSPDALDTETNLLEERLAQTPEKPLVFENKFLSSSLPIKKDQRTKKVALIEIYEDKSTKTTIKDFVNLYNTRFLLLQSILRQRQELQAATTIRKVQTAQNNEQITTIAMVVDIKVTKNNNLFFTLEDQTGQIKAVVNKSNKELFEVAKETTNDEVIGISGTKSDSIFFINSITIPDIPLTKEIKKSPLDEAAIFISDLHIGSKAFLKEPFEKFIDWLCGKAGTEAQKETVKKIKYLFILGDVVDGIGVYPNQEKDLEIKDIFEQYSIFSEHIKKIPKHINIIISPGNHDSLRIAEPQPPLPKELTPELYNLENVYFVSNPSIIKIGTTANFSGFEVLIYHGFSFPFYADTIESIRLKGGLDNTENIMTYLLKKRHLAPTHGSSQYQLGYPKDPLVITKVPDFFVSGHIHKATVKNYKNVTLINSSCWIAQTEYQENRGIVPHPARVIYIDLKTREPKILNFSEK